MQYPSGTKEGNPAVCKGLVAPVRRYVKLNRPDTKKNTSVFPDLIELESSLVVAGAVW